MQFSKKNLCKKWMCSNMQEAAPTTQGEARGRDTCRDGLAGVDINNAGVIVIDDRPDGQMDDATENNDDFEEVLSKKSKKLRQQQINEQLEAVRFFIGNLDKYISVEIQTNLGDKCSGRNKNLFSFVGQRVVASSFSNETGGGMHLSVVIGDIELFGRFDSLKVWWTRFRTDPSLCMPISEHIVAKTYDLNWFSTKYL